MRPVDPLLHALASFAVSPEADSSSYLQTLLQKNAGSVFGREHGFADIRSVGDFRAAVPVRGYHLFEPWIRRAIDGEPAVLTTEPVTGFELTSGSSGAAKAIPFTATFRCELAAALKRWLDGWGDALNGHCYWSISPAGRDPQLTSGGLLLGFASDADYFPSAVAPAFGQWLVGVQPTSMESLADETVARLLEEPDLTAISVWSPAFFLMLDRALQKRVGDARTWGEHWPALRLVSCWADARSGPLAQDVRRRLGGVPLEPKGLLATEGVTTIPAGDGISRLANGIHFHEFIEVETGCLTEPGDLQPGQRYEVVLTTGAGLYRYRTGDLVELIKPHPLSPALRFIGRAGVFVDFCGEKLDESFVAGAFAAAGATGFLQALSEPPRYCLHLDRGDAGVVRDELRRNPYFDQALATGQLPMPSVSRLPPDWMERWAFSHAATHGGRAADFKPPVLLTPESPSCPVW